MYYILLLPQAKLLIFLHRGFCMFGFIALFTLHTVFKVDEFVFCFRILFVLYFLLLFVGVVCLWDGFLFIYRFRFVFLTDSVRSGVEYETQFEFD